MPVLLLAQGDVAAKDMLRRTIEARYGLRPPVIESLHLDFKGRARVKLGPITTWVPVEAAARFLFPTALRWDFTVKPVGVEVQRGVEAFDGAIYRRARGSHTPAVVDDAAQASSMQSRLWAIAAVLLTPLGEEFVRLEVCGDNCLKATNTRFNNVAQLQLRENQMLESVSLRCLNLDNDREQQFVLRLSDEQTALNDLMLPQRISAFWDDEPYFEVQIVRAECNPPIDDSVFTLE